MLSKSKNRQLFGSLKDYHRQYLKKTNPDLDESGTRLMINSFSQAKKLLIRWTELFVKQSNLMTSKK
ncbi:MAG: hypothetical protein HY840_01655 [Bacteroidetes bacterium]|nr:hypothetical protein [Bacteroidota bacterium]